MGYSYTSPEHFPKPAEIHIQKAREKWSNPQLRSLQGLFQVIYGISSKYLPIPLGAFQIISLNLTLPPLGISEVITGIPRDKLGCTCTIKTTAMGGHFKCLDHWGFSIKVAANKYIMGKNLSRTWHTFDSNSRQKLSWVECGEASYWVSSVKNKDWKSGFYLLVMSSWINHLASWNSVSLLLRWEWY